MDCERYDLVIYGASGFTGAYVLEALINSKENKLNFAVAGRNPKRLQNVLNEVTKLTGTDVNQTPIIIADSSNEEELVSMAKQAKVIINVVGPYRLYGEAVVKAAVENGASHVDISGEPAWMESMQMKYGATAKNNGVYIVSGCGWDSIPCDLGVNWLKQHFEGTVSHAETFAHIKTGEAGYSFNSGTYQTLILGLWQSKNDGLGKIRKAIMPEKLQKAKFKAPKRGMLWWNEALQAYCLPFMGADKSVVQRSQYYDSIVEGVYPASFTYWVIAHGWEHAKGEKPNHEEAPTKVVVTRCDGPDAGYIATSGCVLSSALTILHDKDFLPEGGVYTTAAAFKHTNIYKRLESFGITFRVDSSVKVDA